MEKIWKCKIGGEVVGDLPAGADWPMRRAVQTAFETLTGVEASFTFSGWGASLTEGERAVHENREPNWDAMQEAIGAGDGTLHGAIEYWHEEALRLRAELAACSAVIEAARCIRHWHDAPNEGMVVSGSHVRELWKALNNYDAARRGEGEA